MTGPCWIACIWGSHSLTHSQQLINVPQKLATFCKQNALPFGNFSTQVSLNEKLQKHKCQHRIVLTDKEVNLQFVSSKFNMTIPCRSQIQLKYGTFSYCVPKVLNIKFQRTAHSIHQCNKDINICFSMLLTNK